MLSTLLIRMCLSCMAALLVVSCSDDSTSASLKDSNEGWWNSSNISSISNGLNLVSTTLRFNKADNTNSDRDSQWFYFFDGNGAPASPASLALNGVSLSSVLDRQAGNTAMTWNGANHVWTVGGTGSIPSYSDTLASLNRFDVTAPVSFSDTISASSGVVVTWASPGSIDSVLLEVDYDYSTSVMFDSTVGASNWRRLKVVANTGSHTLSAGDLSGVPNSGFVSITVSAIKYKTRTIQGFPVRTFCISSSRVVCPVGN